MLTKNLNDIFFLRKNISFVTRQVAATKINPLLPYPWRNNKTKFHGLLAEILLQRTRAEQVVDVYKKICSKFKNSRCLSKAPLKDIQKIIAPLGLMWRSQKVKEMSAIIERDYAGKVPQNYDDLVLLPGVGDYAASAFLSLHCGKRAPLIDSNIIRLLSRFFGFKTNPETRRNPRLKNLIEQITPNAEIKRFNYALLDISRQICSISPQCTICPLKKKCCYHKKKGKLYV